MRGLIARGFSLPGEVVLPFYPLSGSSATPRGHRQAALTGPRCSNFLRARTFVPEPSSTSCAVLSLRPHRRRRCTVVHNRPAGAVGRHGALRTVGRTDDRRERAWPETGYVNTGMDVPAGPGAGSRRCPLACAGRMLLGRDRPPSLHQGGPPPTPHGRWRCDQPTPP